MNLILFEPTEIAQPLARHDRRADHILRVLRRNVGDAIDVGLIDGPRGKATLNASGLATSRLLPAIVEQFQRADGSVDVPRVLHKWMGKERLSPRA